MFLALQSQKEQSSAMLLEEETAKQNSKISHAHKNCVLQVQVGIQTRIRYSSSLASMKERVSKSMSPSIKYVNQKDRGFKHPYPMVSIKRNWGKKEQFLSVCNNKVVLQLLHLNPTCSKPLVFSSKNSGGIVHLHQK